MMIKYSVRCPFCKRRQSLELDSAKLKRWEGGEMIQNVWPLKSTDERELIKTGICNKCFPKE